MQRILLAINLLLLSNLVFSQSYHAEVIVFENLQVFNSNEVWNEGNIPNYSNSIELALQNAEAFNIFRSDRHKLQNIENTLKLSSIYRPIYHSAWKQPRFRQSNAKKIRIKDLTARIDGAVTVISGHLLHLDIDIIYIIDRQFDDVTTSVLSDMPSDMPSDETENLIQYEYGSYARIQEVRQIRLNELHHFDHPLFGVIIQVTRGSK